MNKTLYQLIFLYYDNSSDLMKEIKVLLLITTMLVSGSFLIQTATSSESPRDQQKFPLSPNALAGTEPLVTNVIRNANFTEKSSNGAPSYFLSSGTPESSIDDAYTGDSHGGSKSYKIQEIGRQFGGTFSTAHYLSGIYLDENVIMDFWFKQSNPYYADAASINLRSFYRATNGTYYYVYYYLSYKYTVTNSSNYAYINGNSTMNTWNNLHLNMTSIFESSFGGPLSTVYFSNFVFSLNVGGGDLPLELLIDDFSLKNGTNYEYEPKGDMETPIPWSSSPSSPGYITTSDIDGRKDVAIMNSTNSGESQFSTTFFHPNFDGYNPILQVSPSLPVLSLDYKIDNTTLVSDYTDYIQMSFNNASTNIQVFIYFDTSYPLIINTTSASSSRYYFMLDPGYIPGTWNTVEINIPQLLDSLNFTDVFITQISFQNILNSVNQSDILMIDNLKLMDIPIGDGDFEYGIYDSGMALQSWNPTGSATINRSSVARSGNYAAEVNVSNNYEYLRKNIFLPVESRTYIDFWWMLENLDASASNKMELNLLIDSKTISYEFGVQKNSTDYTNSSSIAYYLMGEFPSEGVWNYVYRDIHKDTIAAFGQGNWNITYISFYFISDTSGTTTFRVDDIGMFRDSAAPEVNNFTMENTPLYYTNTTFSFTVTDNLGEFQTPVAHYRIDGGSWIDVNTTLIDTKYSFTIPSQNYGQLVEYYITLADVSGNVGTYPSGSYLSYTVGDDIGPTISLSTVANNSRVTGNLSVTVTATDEGSSVSQLRYFIDNESVGNSTGASVAFSINTREFSNGMHLLRAEATDAAGNTGYSKELYFTVMNDKSPPELSDIFLVGDQVDTNVTASISVTDESGVADVLLYYRVDGGAWTKVQTETHGSLYTANMPAIGKGQKMEYYVVATDTFGQSASKGTENNPLSYSFPVDSSTNTTEDAISSIINQATEIYDSYTFLFGMGATVLAYVLLKLLARRFRKKPASS